jgi:hypothetical protein
LLDNVEKYGRAGQAKMTIRRMSIAYCVSKANNKHSDYVIFFVFL